MEGAVLPVSPPGLQGWHLFLEARVTHILLEHDSHEDGLHHVGQC